MVDTLVATAVHPPRDRFLYESVARDLRRKILSGALPAGKKVETHKELAHQFQVSAITVRRAIRDLIVEGLLVSRQGLGVFVSDQRRIVRSLGTASTRPFEDEIRAAGVEPGLRHLSLLVTRASPDVAQRLQIRARENVYRNEKLILGDGEPISREITFLPAQIGRTLESELPENFVFSLLTRQRLAIQHIDFRVEGLGASELDSELLNVAIGFPLIIVHYVLAGHRGRRLATGSIISRTDRLSFQFRASPGG